MFQQHPEQAQVVLTRQPILSTQLLTNINPTDVVMTMSEPAEFEAEMLRKSCLYTWVRVPVDVALSGRF